jgi:hypothetical protein
VPGCGQASDACRAAHTPFVVACVPNTSQPPLPPVMRW